MDMEIKKWLKDVYMDIIQGNKMQTFLPYANFVESAQCLDNKRLGKQRVEAWQIYQCLTKQGSLRWKNHPAVKMWNGQLTLLRKYGIAICNEWIKRGFKDTMLVRFQNIVPIINCYTPFWLGNKKFHSSHRSNLLRKDFTYYSQFGWKEDNTLPYYWPGR